MQQLVYFSRNTIPGGDRQILISLHEIFLTSRKNNSQNKITSFLIFDMTWFMHILEGDKHKVMETYQRIARDRRHTTAMILNVRNIQERSFPGWTMGGSMRTAETEEVYLQHGIGGAIEPSRLKGAQVLALAVDLQVFENAKRSGQPLVD